MRTNHNNLRKNYFRRYYRKNRERLLARSKHNHTSRRITEARFKLYVDRYNRRNPGDCVVLTFF